ncbi:cholesterol oxidase [Nocardia transvalensis]|uniref:Cholesterol oxidase n=1 Tax=Nocardia transvalensis TaxID=37333 RepID=A0A7W9UKL3_9NOCA|nr:GMC family oxidoreductase [Nocardia transvalensis]MBB5916609.1 cholesterol oxidase [Nocardia transvalensis]
MNEHVDVVIVGSGFGGAVAAYRLAEAGLEVVVLERGARYPPGSFPRLPAELARSFWHPPSNRYGLFDVRKFTDFTALTAAGLGGGSLIYANVLARREHEFVREPLPGGGFQCWPVTRADLEPHYDAVERMLTPAPYPLAEPGYAVGRATEMRRAADRVGLEWELPPLAVSFAAKPGESPRPGVPVAESAYGNLHGMPRSTCRLCGECDLGCNDGAKNTLDHTYLSAAHRHGAQLRTLHEVIAIRPGYEVDFVCHEDGAHGTITCDRLVLAAGTFGTTRLLLHSRHAMPWLGSALGTRFSGNGDMVGVLWRAREPLHPSRAPVITTSLRIPGRNAVLQDGGYPGFVDWVGEHYALGDVMTRAARFLAAQVAGRFVDRPPGDLGRDLAELIGSSERSAHASCVLGLGEDRPTGVMTLRGDDLRVEWKTADSAAHFTATRAVMSRVADAMGARLWGAHPGPGNVPITVHPLGGAPMGHHHGEGVCDSYGQVFGPAGLYVADGAAMPGPVGVNPALTIAAMSDRMCTRLLEEGPTVISVCPPAKPAPAVGNPLTFSEQMTGHYAPGTTAPGVAHSGDHPCTLRLTVTITDARTLLDAPARVHGWLDCVALGGRRPVPDGTLHLLARDATNGSRMIRYRLPFRADDGRALLLDGWKDMRAGALHRIWPDLTTMNFRLLDGDTVVGAGRLRISPFGFARQLAGFRTADARLLTAFGRHFVTGVVATYRPTPRGAPGPH